MQRYDSMFGNLYGSVGLLLAAVVLLAIWTLQLAAHAARLPARARRRQRLRARAKPALREPLGPA
jgi:hypothetical protein